MRLPRLFRTSSFRLTWLYAALSTASALILLAIIYGAVTFYMDNEIDGAVLSDLTELQEALKAGGRAALIDSIRDRVRQMPDGPIFYLLADASGGVIGNLSVVAPKAGAFDTRVALIPGGKPRPFHIHGVQLASGDYLLVGADARQLARMKLLILRTFGWGFAITLLLALAGGAMMSYSLLRRIEAVATTSQAIMAGDLSQRIETRGRDDEFDRLAASLNAMLDRTQSSLEGMRQVSDDIAHDLRTPLTRLRQRLELARLKAQANPEFHRAIDQSIADTDAILDTFAALLRIAQLEAGTSKGKWAAVDLSELLLTVAEVYQDALQEKGQRLTVDVAAGLTVPGDRELLVQLMANLVENATRHSPEGAAIAIRAARRDGVVEIAITDTGPGIPAAERRKVFRRFYRLEASRTTPGSGLGLSLVAAIAGLHGIDIELGDNDPGLVVRLRFAATPAPRVKPALREATG